MSECNFCSRHDDSIIALCVGKCLICSKCLKSASIRKLLVGYTNRKSKIDQNIRITYPEEDIEDNVCPLCFDKLAPNTLNKVFELTKSISSSQQVILSEQFVTFPRLLKRFKNGEFANMNFEVPLTVDSRPGSPINLPSMGANRMKSLSFHENESNEKVYSSSSSGKEDIKKKYPDKKNDHPSEKQASVQLQKIRKPTTLTAAAILSELLTQLWKVQLLSKS